MGLMAYSDSLGSRARDVEITIKKAENGFIFELEGSKEIPRQKEDNFQKWENFQAVFVYMDLQEGLKEVEGFFKAIDAILIKKVEKTVEIIKKGRGRPRKASGN